MAKVLARFQLIVLFVTLAALAPMIGAQETDADEATSGVDAVSVMDDTDVDENSDEDFGETEEEEDAPVTLNFVDMELGEVITNISKIANKNFIWDEKVRGKVTIISPEGIPVEEAWRVFEAVMRFNGYQLVPVPGVKDLYKIIRVQEVGGETIPTYTKGLWSPKTESYITRLLKLKYIDAQSASAVLNNLKSKEGKIIPYPPTNTLIVIESANNLNRLVRVLKQMDIPVKLPQVKIVRLQYAPADKLAGELSQIFSDDYLGALAGGGDDASPASPAPPRRPSARRKSTQTQSTGGKPSMTLKIIPDPRTNSLIVIATEDIIDEVLRVIAELDIPIEGEEGIYVHYCQNATATELASTLSSLAGSSTSSRTTTPTVQPSGRTSSISGMGRSSRTTTPSPTSSVTGSLTLGTLSGEVRITADENTNSLVIVASKRDYVILRQVIEKLDIRRRQVFVEAVIIEVEMSDSDSVGTSFAAASDIDNEAAVFGSTALGGLNSMGILPAVATGQLTEALPGGFSVGALTKTVTLNIGGADVEIPTFSALFNALVASNNVNVLSTPNLLTTDNQEAEIIVGQNVPIPTGQTVGTSGTTTVTIQRENVGIKLKVTPQISESSTIRLEIFTEISGVVQTAVAGIDVNTLGITTSVKSAQTTVVVDNHQTVVIGGLIENRVSETTSKVPFLGDIPILGWLFKARTRDDARTNLVILLTPHIVRDAEDTSDLTERYNRRRTRFLEESSGGRYSDPFYFEPLILPEEFATPENGIEQSPLPGGMSGQPLGDIDAEESDWLEPSEGEDEVTADETPSENDAEVEPEPDIEEAPEEEPEIESIPDAEPDIENGIDLMDDEDNSQGDESEDSEQTGDDQAGKPTPPEDGGE